MSSRHSEKGNVNAPLKPFSIKVGRKRLHPGSAATSTDGGSGRTTPEEEEPGTKRIQEGDIRDRDTSSPESGLQIDMDTKPNDDSDTDSLSDLPPEALKATTKPQFTAHMKHFLWVQYPSATTTELNAIIHRKWKDLVASRKSQGTAGKRRRSEIETLAGAEDGEKEELDEDEGGGRRSSRRRAARNIPRTAYTYDIEDMEYADSPASSSHSKDTTTSGSTKKAKGVTRGNKIKSTTLNKGKGKAKNEPRVPPMKIKLIGRSCESDSPIFFAESLESWDEGSGSERGGVSRQGRVRKLREQEGLDSETSSIAFEEVEADSHDSEAEEEEEEEGHTDSEGEHADYCHNCKDGGELLCCDECPLAYHMKCLIPPVESIPDGYWSCPRCKAEPLGGKVEKIHVWRSIHLPIPSLDGDENEEGEDDDVMQVDGGTPLTSPTKKQPSGNTYKIREFFVKWVGRSHWKNSWVSEIRLDVHQPITLRAYMRHRNMDTPPTLELPPHVQRRHKRRSTASHLDSQMEEQEMMVLRAGIRPQWLQIHRIVNKRSSRKGTQYLVKWKELPYTSATWENLDKTCGLKGADDAVQDYLKLRKRMDPKKQDKKERKRGRKDKSRAGKERMNKYEEQPAFISKTGGTLHGYQLEGLNWLRFSWSQGTNTILADEMGLGKTIQTISFLHSLCKEGHSNGPFLITAPLSTIVNWERELEFWAPDLYVVTYSGDRENRASIRENEFSFVEGAVRKGGSKLYKMKKDAPCKFHVLLTSYEFISVDSTVLGSINWEVLVVDEAHRLKNNQSKFFRVLSGYDIKSKLLLTGTPLQNNLEELFHLLNFLSPQDFNSLDQFQEEFEDISKEEQVQKLHELLGPHLLRRLKADVLKNIPPKRELIVRVELSPMQKKFYRWILTRNFEKLNTRGTQPVSLLNVMMDLKKCSNHPYLFPTASYEAPLTANGYYEGGPLTKAAGKFIVLEKMLKKLKKQGHRVLIFSQMTRMLDILEDFLEYLGLGFERIDGNITGSERQRCIDRFNAPSSKQFVFLLSTRAGGLGINLATADTVIIYDSDWNPHNDIQAFSRAHRIGQSNKVMIYRFVTRASVEERITEVAKRKMMLTHLVVRPGMGQGANAPSLSKRELDDILRFGTEELFKEESVGDDQSTTIHYDDKAIEALLDRDQEGVEGDGSIGSENLLANDYLSSFKVASYVMKERDEEPETEIVTAEGETSQKPDPDFWEKLLRHHYEQQAELEAAKLGKGKRIRKQVNYLDASGGMGQDSDQSSYQQTDDEVSEEESDDEVEFLATGSKKLKKSGKSSKFSLSDTSLPPLVAKVNETIYVLGFNSRQRKSFLNSVMRYGMPPPDAYHSRWRSKELNNVPQHAYEAYINLFMRHLCEPDSGKSETYSDGVPKENVSRQNILTRIGIMRLVKNKIEQYDNINGTYSMPELVPKALPVIATKATPEPQSSSQAPSPSEDNKGMVVVQIQPPEEVGKQELNGATDSEQKMDTSETKTEQSEMSEVGNDPVTEKQDSGLLANVDGIKSLLLSNETKPQSPQAESNTDRTKVDAVAGDSDKPKEATITESGMDVDEKPKEQTDASVIKPAKEPVIVYTPAKSPSDDAQPRSATDSQTASPSSQTQRFMFNIADGGFTELHSVWAAEKTKGFSPSVWGRRHDYWLLKAIVTLGYCRWTEICSNVRFVLLNKAFQENSPEERSLSDSKCKFLLKRFKLLEQALAIEEQLHRASNNGLVQDPNHHVMQLHSRFTDLDCLADGHSPLVADAMAKDKHSILLMKKALSKMEELLMEMKTDVARLPNELGKVKSMSKQLKLDEISTISKLAKGSAPAIAPAPTQSVITQGPGAVYSNSSADSSKLVPQPQSKGPSAIGRKERTDVIVKSEATGQRKPTAVETGQFTAAHATSGGQIVQAGQTLQLATGSGVALQTPEGLILYSVAPNTKSTQQPTIVQAANSSRGTITTSSQGQQTYTIGVPAAYVDSGLYLQGQTVQLLPVSAGTQQVMYWPVQGAQTSKVGSQIAVVREPQPVLQPVQYTLADGKVQDNTSKPGSSIITID